MAFPLCGPHQNIRTFDGNLLVGVFISCRPIGHISK